MKRAARRLFRTHLSILLCGLLLCHAAYAERSRIEQIAVDTGGMIRLQVAGEGFDPLLRLEKRADGLYQIVCEGAPVSLESQARQSVATLETALQKEYPGLLRVSLQEKDGSVQLVFVSRRKFQPQVVSNEGARIRLRLIAAASNESAMKTPSAALLKASALKDEPLEKVELDLDEQLAKRQAQEEARRTLIKAQENAWQRQSDASEESFTQLATASAPERRPRLATHHTPAPSRLLPEAPPAQKSHAEPIAPKREGSSLRLSPPPPSWNGDAEQLPTLYKASPGLSGESLYALLADPIIPPAVREATGQAMKGQRAQALATLQNHSHELTAKVAQAFILLNTDPLSSQTADRERACALLKEVIAQTPYVPAYLLLLCNALDEQNLAEAETLLAQAELLHATHPVILFAKGRLMEAKGNSEQAKALYRQVLEQAPYLTEAYYRLSQVALKSGEVGEAQWALQELTRWNPQDARAMKLLAFLAQKRGDSAQALRLYQQALQPDALLNVAHLLAGQKRTADAMAMLEAVEVLADNKPDLLFNTGMMYAELRNAKKARILLNRFITLRKGTGDPRLSQTLEALKKLGH